MVRQASRLTKPETFAVIPVENSVNKMFRLERRTPNGKTRLQTWILNEKELNTLVYEVVNSLAKP